MLCLAWLLWGCSKPDPAPEPATVDSTPPVVSIARTSLAARQGSTLAVFLRTDEAASLALSFGGRDRPLFPVGDQVWRALIGVPIRAEPGLAELEIAAVDAWGNRASVRAAVNISPVEWPRTGKLPMSRRAARVEPDGVAAMRAARDAVYASLSTDQRWRGPMRIPVDGGIHTSAFGAYREYPDGSRNHHDAEDIARRRGVPILASGDGIVALARTQEMHGNAILVDHGQKVVTLYSHLDRIEVDEGQAVRSGDLLGTMGSTGRTTGPHLHWGIVVDQVAVDPMVWTVEAFDPPDAADFLVLGL